MKEIDRMIRDALREEDAAMLEQFSGDQPIHEAITDLFRFRPRWLLMMTMFGTLVAMAVAVWAAIRFFDAAEIRDMIFWGIIFMFCVVGVTSIKIWAWMEMSKNSVTREIKRLALLSGSNC